MTTIGTRCLYVQLLKKAVMDRLIGPPVDLQRGEVGELEVVEGTYWPQRGLTMLGTKRMDNLQYCVETVLHNKIPGDFLEAGVWRGGACIFMAGLLKAYEVRDRNVFVADSFQGLPAPDPQRYPMDRNDPHHTMSFLAVSEAEVKQNFQRFGLWGPQVHIIKGWFEQTLHHHPDIQQLAVLRLDCDMYGSTMQVLEALYDKLAPGGFLIHDDYMCLPRARKAVDDFRTKRKITATIIPIDHCGMYWRKPKTNLNKEF